MVTVRKMAELVPLTELPPAPKLAREFTPYMKRETGKRSRGTEVQAYGLNEIIKFLTKE
jgi:apolipoprotein N-acyltransferase